MGRGAHAIVRQAFADWRQDNAGRLGAALSYYTLFSLAPLLIVAIALAGFFFGREAAQGQIVAQIQGLVGDAGARAVQDMIENSRQPAAGLLATIIGVVTLLLGATGAFAELKGALNIFLPDTEVAWRDVWLGALITSALFTVGKLLIGLYLGRSSVASAYGAAGSVVVLIVWVYYAAQIFFFGAEVTQAYAHRQGSRQERKALVPEPA